MDYFSGRWIVPVEGSPIRNGVLGVEGGIIREVGAGTGVPRGKVHDLGCVAILPGLVNAHCHLELGHLQGKIPQLPFWEWIEAVIAASRLPGETDRRRASIRDGAAQSLRLGVTCLGDISRTGLTAEVLDGIPLRMVCFIELISGAQAPPNDAASLVARFESLLHLENETRRMGISPHAPYSVTEADLRLALEFAGRDDCPLTMHFLETQEELGWLTSAPGALPSFPISPKFRGSSDSRALFASHNELWQAGHSLLAHVNFLPIASANIPSVPPGASVAFCPRTHHFFGHPPHPWRELLARGVNVCLGTDSLASNPDLSILEEMRFLRQAARDVPPGVILQMGTIRGARGLQAEKQIGSLRPGKAADFICIPIESECSDPIASILDGNADVTQVWIKGCRVNATATSARAN